MPQIRFFTVTVLFLLNLLGSVIFAQTKDISKVEIQKMSKQAVVYLNNGNFEKSISTSRKVLHYATKIDDKVLIAFSYNTIGVNVDELLYFDKALFYYHKALFYANQTSNDTIKNHINNNLGNIYCFEKKEYQKGITFYKKAIEYSEKLKDTSTTLFIKLNIAWALFDNHQYKEGLPYLEFVNKYVSQFKEGSTSLVTLNMLNGMYYSFLNNDSKANTFFLKAIELGKKYSGKFDLMYVHEEYSKFLFKIGDYKNAYSNLLIYKTLNGNIYAENILSKANIEGINLELDEYKREVNKIEIEKGLQLESLKKTKIIIVLFVFLILVLFVLLFILYHNNSFKKKINKELLCANQDLIIAKEKADNASMAKSQFLSTISHELRTPLYGVIGITNMLVDEHKELINSPHLSSLKFSARYLLSLINDILDINKIEEKKLVLDSIVFNLLDEMNLIKNSLSFIAHNNNNKISLHIDAQIPEYLIGDKLRLSQILINLVTNALKFTENGEVVITANLIKTENTSSYIEFIVQDSGVGIAESDQDKIFEKFVQVGRTENDYQGTGLGLAIVKRLLELFNSTITLKSKINEGTTFKFMIQFENDPEKITKMINNIDVDMDVNVDVITSQLFKVLVVEDNKINQIIIQKNIEKNNGSCILVNDGFKAIDILKTEKFDVILMDINMPLMNGFETTRKIRENGIQTPIIALTAFDREEVAEEVFSSGMNEIIIKPFEGPKLFQLITDQINSSKNTKQS